MNSAGQRASGGNAFFHGNEIEWVAVYGPRNCVPLCRTRPRAHRAFTIVTSAANVYAISRERIKKRFPEGSSLRKRWLMIRGAT